MALSPSISPHTTTTTTTTTRNTTTSTSTSTSTISKTPNSSFHSGSHSNSNSNSVSVSNLIDTSNFQDRVVPSSLTHKSNPTHISTTSTTTTTPTSTTSTSTSTSTTSSTSASSSLPPLSDRSIREGETSQTLTRDSSNFLSSVKLSVRPLTFDSKSSLIPRESSSKELIPRTSNNTTSHKQNRQSTSSLRQNRSGLFTLAVLARDKTSNAIASLAEPALRSRPSSGNILDSHLDQNTPLNSIKNRSKSAEVLGSNIDHTDLSSSPCENSTSTASNTISEDPTSSHFLGRRQSLLGTNPPSQAYSNTAADTPPLIHSNHRTTNSSKMHQTSSRLLRMTSDDRPFTRDFKDLFATLVVSLPLAAHRIRLTRVEHSFLSEEAINNLGSLKFSQSNRMPDPKDPSRIVTTTTTTTFSMAREMARSVCQRFLDARFIESADGKQAKDFTMKGSIWQLTPKGIHVLERFCSKNGIQQRHVAELVASPRNTMQLVILERDSATDKLSSDRSTIEVIFRRFVGQNGPNIKTSTTSADSDSLSEYKDGIAGVRMAGERKVGSPPRTVYQTFTGKAASRQAIPATTPPSDDKRDFRFQPTKYAYYQLSQKGKDVINMTSRDRTSESEGSSAAVRAGVSRDSNTQKLDKILNDAALRLLFRENLRDTHCEENLSFYLDVEEFLKSCKAAVRNVDPTRGKSGGSLDSVKETMASAYGIYNAFLAPGSPCELNIDHMLRNQLATRMTKAVGQDAAMVESLKEVTKLFEEAQLSVFKLMASDSVPKFMKSSKYEQTLKNYDFDSISPNGQRYNLPERSASKSNR
ncbi:putative developmental regulator flba protein [Botrytis fragariae]|uniref:Putative developmental regulator flba protein n=1 Tax=Botrytis fragariae TaxID=1964551 RepID=A0A8H6AVQ0_9HELO|nr:putative developmental regulator flba protein [Botrytis fragariae]KAF5874325.1 putative developmental regulator flba protein [Botrytis fragariae]